MWKPILSLDEVSKLKKGIRVCSGNPEEANYLPVYVIQEIEKSGTLQLKILNGEKLFMVRKERVVEEKSLFTWFYYSR